MRKITFTPGNIYHIFNRGVEKRDIFLKDSDRWRFLQGMFLFNDERGSANLLYRLEQEKGAMNFRVLREFVATGRQGDRKPLVRIMADCLMPNHYHFLIQEIQDGGISRFMHKFGVGYTKYFNKRHDRVGSLFQGTFKAVPVEEDAHLKYLLVYINVVNPGQLIEPELKEKGVKNLDEIVRFAAEYPWSTHQEYLGRRDSIIIDKDVLGEAFESPAEYDKFTREILLGKKFDTDIVSNLMLDD